VQGERKKIPPEHDTKRSSTLPILGLVPYPSARQWRKGGEGEERRPRRICKTKLTREMQVAINKGNARIHIDIPLGIES